MSGQTLIYLDYAATTPVDDRVFDAMVPYFQSKFANPASLHQAGRQAAEAIEQAREQVARLLGCSSRDVIWTSGATEANNLAIKGLARATGLPHPHIISQRSEHKAVLDPLEALRREGAEITLLEVDGQGQVNPQDATKAIRPNTVMITVMSANNELGILAPLKELGAICKEAGITFHTDASQMAGKLPICMEKNEIGLLSLSAHKLYGPKGVGALIFRRNDHLKRLIPLIDGGGHEGGIRSGTLNVPAIVGLGTACEIALCEMASEANRIRGYRDAFEAELIRELPFTVVNGGKAARLPNISSIAFVGIDAESLLLALDGIAASTGSACTSASIQPSHVLKALGLPPELQRASVRFSFGRQSSADQVRLALEQIIPVARGLHRLAHGSLL